MKVLYIHGINGSPNGMTASGVKNFFGARNVIAEQFDLLKYDQTLNRINDLIAQYKINLIVGHSLGGFYTFALKNNSIPKIVINPCMMPSVSVKHFINLGPLSTVALSAVLGKNISSIEKNLYKFNHQKYFGAFADQDEFPSFKDFFDQSTTKSKSIIIKNAHHRLDGMQMSKVLNSAMAYFKKV